MIYKNINTIPYPFLKNAVASISKNFEVQSVRVDFKGEVYVRVSGQLNDNEVKDILKRLTPKGFKPIRDNVEYSTDYNYAETSEATYVYSPEGINYTKTIGMDSRELTRLLSTMYDTVELREKTGCRMKDEYLRKFILSKFPSLTKKQMDYIMKII